MAGLYLVVAGLLEVLWAPLSLRRGAAAVWMVSGLMVMKRASSD